MSYTIIEKIRVSMDNWDYAINLQTTYANVKAVKIKWLLYQTASYNNVDLVLKSDLGNAGIKPNPDNSNVRYFVSFPLDRLYPVSLTYGNSTNEYDIVYQVPKNIGQIHLQAFINGLPATVDVSPSNTIDFEIGFYQ